MKRFIATATVLALAALPALVRSAEHSAWKLPPETAQFKKAPGAELATGQCLLCHSADYIATQPRLDRAAWTGIVVKMREKYGAPILTNNVDAVVNYLVANYGK